MSKYDAAYLETHDIDWFCKIGNTAMHRTVGNFRKR